jgi:hypothetical protein
MRTLGLNPFRTDRHRREFIAECRYCGHEITLDPAGLKQINGVTYRLAMLNANPFVRWMLGRLGRVQPTDDLLLPNVSGNR